MLTQAQLEKFCTKAEGITPSGNDIKQPIRHDGYIYATDGRICIRVDDDESIQAIAPLGRMKGYDFAKLFTGEENVVTPIPPLPDRIECPYCHGTCLEHGCIVCDGEGTIDSGITPVKCQTCGGTGKVEPGPDTGPCWWCNGRGEHENNPVAVGNTHFNRVYLALAAEMPGARFVRVDGLTTARIKFDGGEIAIMPTRANHYPARGI